MEGIAPPLKLVLEVKRSIECGESVRSGLLSYIQNTQDEFAILTRKWLIMRDQGQNALQLFDQESVYRKNVINIVDKGLSGQSVLSYLNEMEEELVEISREEIEKHISLLPFKLLVPLMAFQFPAFLLLLFGPLLNRFLSQLGA